MRETKFKIGQKPWTIEAPYYKSSAAVLTIQRAEEELVEVHIVITKYGEKEIPYHAKGQFDTELYRAPVYATREEALEAVRETYREHIKYFEEQAEFFKGELEGLE